MKDKTSPLFSTYILDGVQMDETPFSALYDCLDGDGSVEAPKKEFEPIIDEYMDKVPSSFEYDPSKIEEYALKIIQSPYNRKRVDMSHPVAWTRNAINSLLLETIFKDGHFTLENLLLMCQWDWVNSPAGNMAAFYDSTVTAGRYLADLGVKLDRYFIESNWRHCLFEIVVRSKISSRRKCSERMQPSASDWVVFIPFDDVAHLHLGGSALSTLVGEGSGSEMDGGDPAYFADCFEVVRELVEDGVITAGVPVGRGGLMVAAEKFRSHYGLTMDIGGFMQAKSENDMIKALFAEIPGVLVQFRDIDYDYVDAQLMLQDIAYYPVGHPEPEKHELNIAKTRKNDVSGILSMLLGQATEGED